MSDAKRPPVWQLVLDAVKALGGKTTNVAVRDWILARHPEINRSTIQCQIIACTVNHASRVHYPMNGKPRRCNGPHDILFSPERGRIELYDPARDGTWEIAARDDGSLAVRRVDGLPLDQSQAPEPTGAASEPCGSAFAAEDHFRDYLVRHLEDIEPGLALYVDDQGTDGVEYVTDIGRIDILANDTGQGFVVVELKVAHGPDSVCGQLMRYISWVKRHLANGKPVRGIIIAQHISDKIRYALADVDNVELKEYEISLKIRDVERLT